MSQVPSVRPVWAAKAIVRAVWVAAGESPEWIAARTDALLSELGAAFDIEDWQTPEGRRWEGSPDELTEIVRSHVITGMFGEPEPESGYGFTVSGAGPRVGFHVHVAAGLISPGGRIPGHHLTIDLREMVVGGSTSQTADTVCAAVAQTWEPSVLDLADSPVNRTARRGNWKIGVGYRLWISEEVGAIAELAEGLTSAPLAKGTLVSAPDDWPAERVVAAMTQTLAANGLDEVPH
ncbi:hypothetical protein [Mycobacterium talmoniae]|uniref:Uncharacterized protein n=1 Tax=Mycobacterium talmoniae TaxID=1858794 RepID=A0A1S1MD09_9MYCO|nr:MULTISPECIES: hypothetical protein [Mycobacterium]OHU82914.1 hypothetical protein BKN37_26840 [Mycobacterium talmoniae]PQM44523.1 hypothetical protein C1Y40_05317 [Mycobacterium talmoniae]TDH48070.1 hypothetical protein E2F47_25260 [Mycobacterium eburneum]